MLTQEQYTLYTGQAIDYTESDWQAIVTIAEMRLASFLCLDLLPTVDESGDPVLPADLAMLLANFIAAVIRFQGNGDTIESKSVRNFTIHFKTSSAADAFAQIASQYQDIIDKYSKCDLGLRVERYRRCCCGYYGRI